MAAHNQKRWRWRPNLAVVLVMAMLLTPLAFVYLNRARWAIIYVALSILLIPIWLHSGVALFAPLLVLMVMHAIWLQRRYDIRRSRAWSSRPLSMVVMVASVLSMLVATRVFVLEPFRIPSASMHPYLQTGDFILVSKLGFGTRQTMGWKIAESQPPAPGVLRRGEVYVFQHPRTGITFVKRMLAVPGDTVELRDQKVWRNGEALALQELSEGDGYRLYTEDGANNSPGVVADPQSSSGYTIRRSINRPVIRPVKTKLLENEYFFMGDNRDHSIDSRVYGAVPGENIIGRVSYVLRPSFE